jgi:uncharacterized protein
MTLDNEQTLLRVYLRNTDRCGPSSAADVLVEQALARRLGAVSVLQGISGLDASGELLETSGRPSAERVPVIIECLDAPHAIGRFLSVVEGTICEGVVTLQAVVRLGQQPPGAGRRGDGLPHTPAEGAAFASLPSPQEFPLMSSSEEGKLLRVFLDDSATCDGEPLFRALLRKAQELGLAVAAVLEVPVGFGPGGPPLQPKPLGLATATPLVVEAVASPASLPDLRAFLERAMIGGRAVLESVRVLGFCKDDWRLRACRPGPENLY